MLGCYYKVYTISIKGVEYLRTSGMIIMDHSEAIDSNITIGWNDLTDFYHEYGLYMPFNIWNFKKGRLISFFDAALFDKRTWDIKEWKEPLKIDMQVAYKDYRSVSISDILNYHDHKLAMQYLSQEGMTING